MKRCVPSKHKCGNPSLERCRRQTERFKAGSVRRTLVCFLPWTSQWLGSAFLPKIPDFVGSVGHCKSTPPPAAREFSASFSWSSLKQISVCCDSCWRLSIFFMIYFYVLWFYILTDLFMFINFYFTHFNLMTLRYNLDFISWHCCPLLFRVDKICSYSYFIRNL